MAQAKSDKKPNILIIWGDDIGWFNISAYNHGIMSHFVVIVFKDETRDFETRAAVSKMQK